MSKNELNVTHKGMLNIRSYYKVNISNDKTDTCKKSSFYILNSSKQDLTRYESIECMIQINICIIASLY